MKRTPLISSALAALLLAASSIALADGPRHGGHGYRDDGPRHAAKHGYRHGASHGYRHGARHGYRHGARHGYRHGYRPGNRHAYGPRHRHGPHCRHAAYPVYRPGIYFGGPVPYPQPYRYPGGHVSLYFDF